GPRPDCRTQAAGRGVRQPPCQGWRRDRDPKLVSGQSGPDLGSSWVDERLHRPRASQGLRGLAVRTGYGLDESAGVRVSSLQDRARTERLRREERPRMARAGAAILRADAGGERAGVRRPPLAGRDGLSVLLRRPRRLL